MTLKLEKVVML